MTPNSTTAFLVEYQALKSGLAVVALDNWSSISITGVDRQRFLHNFCTNDVKRLVPGLSCEAYFTNIKGKLVGHGLLHCRETEVAFIGAPGQSSQLISHLDRYIIREDVQLRDTTGARHYLLVVGEIRETISHVSLATDLVGRADAQLFEVGPAEVLQFARRLTESGFVVAGAEALATVRIEAGVPLFGKDFTAENLPQEVGRDRQAISFTKGCYLGQETVARIDALGHVNQQIVSVRFLGNDIPAIGEQLCRDSQVVGTVTSAAYSPALQSPLCLAMVRREATTPGTPLISAAGECKVVTQSAVA